MSYDFHVHSENSFDSKEKIELICKEALNKNIFNLAFTEHFCLETNKKTFGHIDFNKYFREIKLAKDNFPNLNIYTGLELCEPHLKIQELKEQLDKLEIDFILGSVHNINNKGLRDIAKSYNSKECYNIYFEEVLKMVSIADFDVLAHLDLISRYAYDFVGNYEVKDHLEIIKEILKTLIKRNKGIEINTSGLRKSINNIHPKIEVLKIYKNLGGKIITIGSDAHKAEDVGKDCYESLCLLKELGFKNIYIFKNRNPIVREVII